MKWIECDTLEDLKLLGSFNCVKELIKKDLDGLVIITARSWTDLFFKLESLKFKFVKASDENESIWVDGFISETHKYLFCLLELDGENRMKHLGITKLHYMDVKVAKRWRNSIFHKIHTDICHDPRAKSAVLVLDELYSEMVQ
ncbi:TPA: hypothetical protein ACSP3X_000351 [Aeromonas hydrophila]